MRLSREFIRLPLTFDAPRLIEEITALDERDWRPHPQGYPGNSALPLIAVNGDPDDDDVKGPMRATTHLERCPYLRQVLAAFHAVWGRTRLMRLDGNAEATAHADTNYYWTRHARVHVPIVTGDDVEFRCGDASVHMAAGEAWIFDTWRIHNVINPHPTRRIHLVADTIGSAAFWELVDRGASDASSAAQHVPYDPLRAVAIATESFNHPVVMPPAEMNDMIELVLQSAPQDASDDRGDLRAILRALRFDWQAAFARFGETAEGFPLYRQLLDRTETALAPLAGSIRLINHIDALDAVRNVVLRPALGSADKNAPRPRPQERTRGRHLDRPVFVVCPPRSGSSLFFETLSQSPTVWTGGGESHAIIESIPTLHPEQRRYHSNRLDASDATPEIVQRLERSFLRHLRNRDGQPPQHSGALRLLEKTPKNSLRVPFLAEAFPDALFVYLYRDMRDTISSMLDAWRSGKFVTYPALPGWDGLPWSLLLTPGWRELSGKPLAEIVAAQWSTATRYLLDDLEQLRPERWCVAGYDALLDDPQQEVARLARFLDIEWDRTLDGPLPLSRTTLTAPNREKWKRNGDDLKVALPLVAGVAERARNLFANPPVMARKRTTPPPAKQQAQPVNDFRSVFTPSVAEVLDKAGASLVISTYQSGRLIIARVIDGKLNTHFRAFASPMGIALTPQMMTLGTKNFVWHFRNHPGVAEKLEGAADAAYVPAAAYGTGDIRVHELAYAANELVIVNTRFSCLAAIDPVHSFRETWRPSFITDIVPEDRCHLNGVAVIDGVVRYVTALGESNEKEGWRANKGNGGIVIDTISNEVIARGLSMPHSPRWHDGKLWVLESGEGRLCTIDSANGAKSIIAEVPGFARGLAFAGPYAFIGLSQVRERVFDGIPIAARPERNCGVWLVDVRNGKTVGFIRFEGSVQEIFDVQLLGGVRRPDVLEPTDDYAGAAFTLPASQ